MRAKPGSSQTVGGTDEEVATLHGRLRFDHFRRSKSDFGFDRALFFAFYSPRIVRAAYQPSIFGKAERSLVNAWENSRKAVELSAFRRGEFGFVVARIALGVGKCGGEVVTKILPNP